MPRKKIDIEKLLKKGDSLPALPEIYTRVSNLLESKDSSVNDIGDIIESDPAISYKILTMVNSAYFGMPSEVSSVSRAVSLLGRFRLKQILIGTLMSEIFKGLDSQYFSLSDFWQHSIRTAIIARQLAVDSDYLNEPEPLFTAGLLHDVGRLILAAQMPEVFPEIAKRAEEMRWHTIDAEIDIIGMPHTEIGAALMLKWEFPDLIWVSVRNHHQCDYNGPFFHAAHIVYLADQLAHCEPPEDEVETREVLSRIPNWEDSNASLESVEFACLEAEGKVSDVMNSLGMT